MKKILYVAEKPATMKAVAGLIPGERKKMGSGFVIGNHYFAPLQGHIMVQASPDHYLPNDIPTTGRGTKVWREQDLPIIPKQWKLAVDPNKKHLFDTVQQMLAECDEVVHLGDADQEGQLIVDEVLDFLGNRRPVNRVLILDYNEKKVREAMNAIKPNNDPVFQGWSKWALARSRYDFLLGINCTRIQTLNWRKAGGNGVMPVGSVQTPLLKIIVDRDREIEGFQAKAFFTISALVNHENGSFKVKWNPSSDQPGLDSEGRLIDAKIAQDLNNKFTGCHGVIVEYATEDKKKHAPLLYALSDLQMEANDIFGYSAKDVLDTCQFLYDEAKLISYPRVDTGYVFEVNHGEGAEVLAAIASNMPSVANLCASANPSIKSAAFNDTKIEIHHGILPTLAKASTANLTEIQRNIYEMIVKRYIAQFYPAYEYKSTSIKIEAEGESFTAKGQVPQKEGWRVVLKADRTTSDEENEESVNLPPAKEGDNVQFESVDIINKKTTPPPRFTEKLILQAMLNIHKYVADKEVKKRLKDGDGIGTEATRAAHIEGLKDSGYIVQIKKGSKQYVSTSEARALIDALQDVLKEPGTAGVFKLDLDRVSAGELSFQGFMAQTEAFVSSVIANAKTSSFTAGAAGPACPTCLSGTLRRIKGKNGFFWACSNFQASPACKATFEDSKTGPVLQKDEHSCPACKIGTLRKIKGTSGPFWGCSRYKEDCKFTSPDKKGKPDLSADKSKPQSTNEFFCTDCNKPLIHRHKAGKDGYDFWGCSGFKDGCRKSFKNKAGKPEF